MKCTAITESTLIRCQRNVQRNSQYCWQHQPSINILNILPLVIFGNIGEFLEQRELGLIQASGFPREIFLKRSRVYMKLTTIENIYYMIKYYNRLKILYLDDYNLVINEDFLTQLITVLKSVKLLEALTIRSDFIEEKLQISWLGFQRLRYLEISDFINNDQQVHDLVNALPTLEHLVLNSSYFNNIGDKKIQGTLKFISHFSTTTDLYQHINLLLYPNLKALQLEALDLSDLKFIQQLDVLMIDLLMDIEFMNHQRLQHFPPKLRFLRIPYLGREGTIFDLSYLPYRNLEYLGLADLRPLRNIIDSLFQFPKLQHLFVLELSFSLLNDLFLKKLSDLKKKIPLLTFDFQTTRINNLINDSYEDEELANDHILIQKENQTKYWHKLQKIFNLSNLIFKSQFQFLEFNQYPPSQWLRDNGYYI